MTKTKTMPAKHAKNTNENLATDKHGRTRTIFMFAMKIAAKNAKEREEKNLYLGVPWCLGALVAKVIITHEKHEINEFFEF